MKLAKSLYNGSLRMYVPVQVRSLGNGNIRLQIPYGSSMKEYDLDGSDGVVEGVSEAESSYADAGGLVASLYHDSNKYYVPAQLRVINNFNLRLQIADAETGNLKQEHTWKSSSEELVSVINASIEAGGEEETPQVEEVTPPVQEAPVASDSIVTCLVATIDGIKADIDDLVNEQVRMLALVQAMADLINNL